MTTREPSSVDIIPASLAVRTILRPYYAGHVRSLGLRGNERLLDFGSGPGAAAVHLAAALDVKDGAYDVVFIHFVLHDIPAGKRPETARHAVVHSGPARS